MRHHFTVDVEEYFQVSAFERHVPRSSWSQLPQRLSVGVPPLLELLGRHQSRGTFFVLGWVVQHQPDIVRAISQAGHEVASHGWDHRRVTTQTPVEFRESVRRTKQGLESLIGKQVFGFRAPSFSIVPGCEWALDVLIEEGYTYDSSLFPVRRPGGYGYPGIARHPHQIRRPSGTIIELPPTTLRRLGVSIPAAGGAYFRILPYAVARAAFRECERGGVPGTFYVHPWELDPEQPRMSGSVLSKLRHYTGLARTGERLERLLEEFNFTAIADTVDSLVSERFHQPPAGEGRRGPAASGPGC